MRASINPQLCTACGLCQEICPDVFEVSGGVTEATPCKLKPSSEALCKNAAEHCPNQAITIFE